MNARLPLLIAATLFSLAQPVAGISQPAWNPAPWLADVEQMRAAFLTKYANREWLEQQRGVAIDPLFDRLAARIKLAGSDAAARAVIDRTLDRIGDGHVVINWPEPTRSAVPAGPTIATPPTAAQFCAAQGFNASIATPGIAVALPGYQPLTDAGEMAAGQIKVDRTTIGVLRIPAFDPHAFHALCQSALGELSIDPTRPCDDACADQLITRAYDDLTADMATRLRQLRAAGAAVLMIDLTGNGGGSEWVEAAARMVTARRLTSSRAGFVRGTHWASQWRDLAGQLAGWASDAAPEDRTMLRNFASQARAAQRVAETPCDPATGCDWIGQAGYSAGLVGTAAPDAYRGKPWGPALFSPSQFPYAEGVWDGPVIVLVDQETWSAAEEFAVLLQDNQAALVLGARTGGAGCGHTNGGTPTLLANSGATLELPDCVRFRADGSNEVDGVVPDVLIGWRTNDGMTFRTRLLAAALPEAIGRVTTSP